MSENAYAYFDGLTYPENMPADGILSRTILDNPTVRFVLFYFAAGQELSEHTAALPAVIHIIEGDAQLTFGGDEKEAHAGDFAYMTPGLKHAVYARTPVIMLLQLIKQSKPKT